MEEVLKEFPYFQTARLVHLKNLSNTDDIHFEKELRKTAAYAGDRKVLYYLILQKAITEKAFQIDTEITKSLESEQPTEIATKETVKEKIEEDTIEEILQEEVVSETKKEPSALDELILQGAISASLDRDIEEIAEEELNEEETIEETLEDETQEIDISNLSFTEWLKYSSGQQQPKIPSKSIENIIDDFIQNEPKISKPKTEFFSPTELARKSVEDHEDIVTETLANIYLAQGNYNKAIKAFERLSLNYPEKSTYFAARIKSTQDLMKEN